MGARWSEDNFVSLASFLEPLVQCTRQDAEPRDDEPDRHLSHPRAAPRQPLAALLWNVLRCQYYKNLISEVISEIRYD